MGFKWDSRRLQSNLRDLDDKVNDQIKVIFDFQTLKASAHMKTTAPWTDQTGAARSGLFAQASHAGTHHEIIMSHSVAYGIWLEIANSGEYQVILPSVRFIGRETMQMLNNLFGDIR